MAVTWFQPQLVEDLDRPRYSIWSEGESSATRDGFPFAWSPTGDKLILQHPFAPSRGLEGWIDVISWPGFATIFEGDHDKNVGDALFDPTGGHIAYSQLIELGPGDYAVEIAVVTLETGDITRVPVGSTFSFAWNAASELIVSDVDAGTLATYRPDGSQVSSQIVDDAANYATGIQSSADGSTLLLERSNRHVEGLHELTIERAGRTTRLSSGDGMAADFLSPNGQRLIVVTGRQLGIADLTQIQ